MKIGILFILPLLMLPVSCSKRYSGSITGSKIWKGKVKLTGDVVVERRSHLKIMPGTVISYARKPDRQVRYIRQESGGSFNILQDDRIEILVSGSLEAAGTGAHPIKLKASETSGGMIFLGKEKSKLSHVLIQGAPAAIRVYGENSPEISSCLIQDSPVVGVGMWDLAAGHITGTVFKNCRHAIGTADFASPEISSCSVLFSKMAGIFAEGNSSPRIGGCLVTGNNIGIAGGDISSPEIKNCRITGNGAGVSLWVKTKAKIEKNIIMGNVTGILVQAEARATVSSNNFKNNGSGISCVNAGAANIKGNVFTGGDAAVILRDSSRVTVKDNRIRSAAGIKVSEVADADIEDNVFSGTGIAVTLENRSTARLKNNYMKGVKKELEDRRVKH